LIREDMLMKTNKNRATRTRKGSMTHLKEENIRAAAVEYLKKQLGKGKSLTTILLQALDFGTGDVIALSPTPLSPAETTQFDWGHVPPNMAEAKYITVGNLSGLATPVAKANDQLVDLICNSLAATESVCLMENWLSDAGDAWLQRAKSLVITHGEEVYHLLTTAHRDKKKIEDARREAEHLPVFTGAVGRIARDVSAKVLALKIITTEQLAAFSTTVECVFAGAYDGEGYVVWIKEGIKGTRPMR